MPKRRRQNNDVSSNKRANNKFKTLPDNWADVRNIDESKIVKGPSAKIISTNQPLPVRKKASQDLHFEGFPSFKPNKTPREIIDDGAFGGCYFRSIKSGVLDGKILCDQHKEFDFFTDLPDEKICSSSYNADVNKYKVPCGGSLQMWQSKGWISPIDPYGWFQWYCRFYNGRRCEDDKRQIDRWQRCTGEKGRWKRNLITKINKAEAKFDDFGVSPVVRQTLLHWAYEITEDDI